MASLTYYVVLPFVRNEEGELCPEEAIECRSTNSAISRALCPAKAGAVAFSRTGDPDLGEFTDALVLAEVGEVPTDLDAVSGA